MTKSKNKKPQKIKKATKGDERQKTIHKGGKKA